MIKIKDIGWGKILPEGYKVDLVKDLPLLKKVTYLWITIEITVNIFAWWNKTLTFKYGLKAY
jgi:hypothetical protein